MIASIHRSPVFFLWSGVALIFAFATGLRAQDEKTFTPEISMENRVLIPASRFLDPVPSDASGKPLPPWLSGMQLLPPDLPGLGWTYRVNFLTAETGKLFCRIWYSGGSLDEELVVSSIDAAGEVIDLQLISLSGGSDLESGGEILISIEGAVALEITDSAREARVRQFELIRLALREQWLPLDSAGSENPKISAYPTTTIAGEDVAIRGSVVATLQDQVNTLGGTEESVLPIAFDLLEVPEMALLVMEIAGVELESPPECYVNEVRLRSLALHLPGLGDPSYLKLTKSGLQEPSMQVTGWVEATAYIPARLLKSGENEILIALPEGISPLQVRGAVLHLKYPSQETQNKVIPSFYE